MDKPAERLTREWIDPSSNPDRRNFYYFNSNYKTLILCVFVPTEYEYLDMLPDNLRYLSAADAGQSRVSSHGRPGYGRGRGSTPHFGTRGRGRGGPHAFYQPASKVPRFGLDPNDR